MTAVPLRPQVDVLDHEVRFHFFVSTDANLRRVLAAAADPVEATHIILEFGAQMFQVAGASLDAQIVERRFDDLARRFEATVNTGVSQMSQISSQLLDGEDGALPRFLNQHMIELKTLLNTTFDPDSKSSVIGKIIAILDGAVEQLNRRVGATLDPDTGDSPLGKVKQVLLDAKRELQESAKEIARDQDTKFQDILIAVADKKARAQVTEKTAGKGFAFEEIVLEGVARIAAFHGDVVEHVGKTSGLSGTNNGDIKVTLNPEATFGHDAPFVVEAKDRPLSMNKTTDEQTKAMNNHGAKAAIAAFSRAEYAPREVRQQPVWWSGNRAVVIYDKDAPDEYALALQLAYERARWICLRELTADRAAIDAGRVEALIKRARQALTREKAARACITQAKNQLDEGAGHVADMVDDVRAMLDELAELLKKG